MYPNTPQDESPHGQDGLWGRNYLESFDENELGRAGDNEILNIYFDERGPADKGTTHVDVTERNTDTGCVYKNRIWDPEGFESDPTKRLDVGQETGGDQLDPFDANSLGLDDLL